MLEHLNGAVESLAGQFDGPEQFLIAGPAGSPVGLSGDPADTGDHRTFTIDFASGQLLAGTYAFVVGPDVRDGSGNWMNQDGDPINGETNGDDDYAGSFDIGPVAARDFPHSENFIQIFYSFRVFEIYSQLRTILVRPSYKNILP